MFQRILFLFARRFVAGLTMEEAVTTVRRLNQTGIQATLDVLGENVSEARDADAARLSYLATLDSIQSHQIQSNVSLKLTQMGLDIGRDFCLANLVSICERARSYQNFVRIDMEGSGYTEKTLSLFETCLERSGNAGIVLQAYLHRTEKDLERVISLGGRVRLCKGAYKEAPERALQTMPEIRRNFLRLTEILLERGDYPAIATHDDYLIHRVRQMAAERGVPRDRFEFQMLYGIRPDTQRRLAGEGYRMRVYVPYGTRWLPYFYRRLRERKENVLFLARNFFKQ